MESVSIRMRPLKMLIMSFVFIISICYLLNCLDFKLLELSIDPVNKGVTAPYAW